jgi:hypothetical protein
VWEWAAAAGQMCVLEVCLEVTNLLGEARRLTIVMHHDGTAGSTMAVAAGPPRHHDTRRLSLDSSTCSAVSQVRARVVAEGRLSAFPGLRGLKSHWTR